MRDMVTGTGMSAKNTDAALKNYTKVINAATLNPCAKIDKATLVSKGDFDTLRVRLDPRKYSEAIKKMKWWIVRGKGDGNNIVSVFKCLSLTLLSNDQKDEKDEDNHEFILTNVWGSKLSVDKMKGAIVFFIDNQFTPVIENELMGDLSKFPKTWISKMDLTSFIKLSEFLSGKKNAEVLKC